MSIIWSRNLSSCNLPALRGSTLIGRYTHGAPAPAGRPDISPSTHISLGRGRAVATPTWTFHFLLLVTEAISATCTAGSAARSSCWCTSNARAAVMMLAATLRVASSSGHVHAHIDRVRSVSCSMRDVGTNCMRNLIDYNNNTKYTNESIGKMSMTFSRSRADKKRDYKLIIYAFNQVELGRTLRIRCVAAESLSDKGRELRFVRLITSHTERQFPTR